MLDELKALRDDLSLTLGKLLEEQFAVETQADPAKASAAEQEIQRLRVLLANVQFGINHMIAMDFNAVAAELEHSIQAQRAVGLSRALEMMGQLASRLRSGSGTGSTPSPFSGPGQGPSSEPGGQGPIPDAPPSDNMNGSGPANGGPASRFVQARKIAAKTILYVDADGREFRREGGTRSWRNFNPGNIRKGNFATTVGAIGDDGAFAIFPDYKTGLEAIVTLLKSSSYINLSLRSAVFRYAPPNENNSEAYAAFLEQETGIPGDKVLSSLSVSQIRNIAKVIQKVEGWQEGIEQSDSPGFQASGGVSSAAGAALDWMDIAGQEAALPENQRTQWTDPGDNPRILNYFKVGCSWFDPAEGDEVDWCAAFLNYCLVTAGYVGTNHPGARSFFWNKKNQFVPLTAPRFGAVAVRRYAPFSDPAWETGTGHVGFVQSWTSSSVTLLGGNQSRTVRLQTYPLEERNSAGQLKSKFVVFMMPVTN